MKYKTVPVLLALALVSPVSAGTLIGHVRDQNYRRVLGFLVAFG